MRSSSDAESDSRDASADTRPRADSDSVTRISTELWAWWHQILPTLTSSFYPLSRSSTASSSSSSSSTLGESTQLHASTSNSNSTTTSSNQSGNENNGETLPLPPWALVWDWNYNAEISAAVGVGSDSFSGDAVVRSRARNERGWGGDGRLRRTASVETLPAYEPGDMGAMMGMEGEMEGPPAYEP